MDDVLTALRTSPKTASQKAKFILVTDGEAFQAEDMNGGGSVACSYSEFPDHFGFFLPLAGITTVEQIRESSFDIKATGRLNRLYVELLKDNPDWASRPQDMNHFMARLIFCFFAEDTDIFLSNTSNSASKPNIMILVDNTSNWSRQAQQWPDNGGTQGAAELAAVRNVVTANTTANIGLAGYTFLASPKPTKRK